MNNYSRIAALLAASLLAACSGGGARPIPQLPQAAPRAPQPSPSAPVTSASRAQFTIAVPRAATVAPSSRRPQYVSPNTGSVRISILSADGVAASVPDTVARIAYAAPGCASDTSQPLTCAVSVSAPVGKNVAFSISTYQSADASGAVLATATLSAPIVAGKSNIVPITLGGVPSSIAITPSALGFIADGKIHTFHLTVNALDASGATIVGGTPLASPVSLAIAGDSNSALQLSTNNVTMPGQPVQVTYCGCAALDNATISATSGNFTSSLTVAPLQLSPLSVQLMSGKTTHLTVHEGGFSGPFSVSTGNASLATVTVGATTGGTSTITLASVPAAQGVTTLTIGDGKISASVPFLVAPVLFNYFTTGVPQHSTIPFMTNGPNGKLWFTDSTQHAVGVFDPVTGVAKEYTAGLGPNDDPDQIVTGPDGNVYFTNLNFDTPSIGRINPSTGAIQLLPVPSSGTTTSITVGPDHNIWFATASFGTWQLGVFDLTTQTTALYPLPSSAFVINSLTTGPDGRVWFTDSLGQAIGVMDPTTHVATEYTAGLGPNSWPWVITTGPDGNLWFTDRYRDGGSGETAVGKVDPSTGTITEYPVATDDGLLLDGIVSAQGKLWFAAGSELAPTYGHGGSWIGTIDPSSTQITQHSLGMSNWSLPYTLTLGPDNELWYGDLGEIGQVVIQ